VVRSNPEPALVTGVMLNIIGYTNKILYTFIHSID